MREDFVFIRSIMELIAEDLCDLNIWIDSESYFELKPEHARNGEKSLSVQFLMSDMIAQLIALSFSPQTESQTPKKFPMRLWHQNNEIFFDLSIWLF